jgi:hypothetical protein
MLKINISYSEKRAYSSGVVDAPFVSMIENVARFERAISQNKMCEQLPGVFHEKQMA